jgi:hypothetical protein
MPDPLAHHPAMLIIKSDSLPPLWWLNPWGTAKTLHQAVTALKPYADRIDDLIDIQSQVIDDQSAEIRQLRERLADLHDSITAGASVPDAKTYE